MFGLSWTVVQKKRVTIVILLVEGTVSEDQGNDGQACILGDWL